MVVEGTERSKETALRALGLRFWVWEELRLRLWLEVGPHSAG